MQAELVMKTPNSQHGMALLILVFFLALVATAYVVKTLDAASIENERAKKTAVALTEAKSALLGWSVLQNNPGQLPCPEDIAAIGTASEGQAQVACTSPSPVIGRLPWRTLGLGDIRDGNDDKLWYVISTGFRTSPINLNSLAQLTLNGTPNSAVAIIFSVGIPLAGQFRPASTAAPVAVTNYLEGSNSDGDNTFVSNGAPATLNDKLMVIKQSELFSLVTNRILREIKGDSTQGLVNFYLTNAYYPFADSDADGNADNTVLSGAPSYKGGPTSLFFNPSIKTTLANNGWFPLISYDVTGTQQAVTLTSTLNSKTLTIP